MRASWFSLSFSNGAYAESETRDGESNVLLFDSGETEIRQKF